MHLGHADKGAGWGYVQLGDCYIGACKDVQRGAGGVRGSTRGVRGNMRGVRGNARERGGVQARALIGYY